MPRKQKQDSKQQAYKPVSLLERLATILMKLTARKFSLESLINTAKTEITTQPVSSTTHVTWGQAFPMVPRPPLPEVIKALKEESARIYQLCKAMEGELVLDAMSKTKADIKDVFTSSGVSIQSSPTLPQNPNWTVGPVVKSPYLSPTVQSLKNVGIDYYAETQRLMEEQYRQEMQAHLQTANTTSADIYEEWPLKESK